MTKRHPFLSSQFGVYISVHVELHIPVKNKKHEGFLYPLVKVANKSGENVISDRKNNN